MSLCLTSTSQAQIPLRLSCDAAVRKSAYIPDLNNNNASVSFVRGDDVLIEIGLFQNGHFVTNLNTYSNLSCQIFTSQNSANGPLMTQAVTNGTAAWNNNVNYNGWISNSPPDTNWHAQFYFPDTQTSIPLNGQPSQTYWMRVAATGTNNRISTFLEGPVTVYDGPISPDYIAPAFPFSVAVDQYDNLYPPQTNFFVVNSNLLQQAIGTLSTLVIKTNLAVGGTLAVTHGATFASFSSDAGYIASDGSGDLTVNGNVTMPLGAGAFYANGNQVTGANLVGSTNLNANLAFGGGIIPQQYEGSGAASSASWLRGDHTWQSLAGNGAALTNLNNGLLPGWKNLLRQWVQGQAYQPVTNTTDQYGNITNATILWPDGTYGVFSATNIDATFLAVDGYAVTYTNLSETVAQPTVTRNQYGAITNAPVLIITP